MPKCGLNLDQKLGKKGDFQSFYFSSSELKSDNWYVSYDLTNPFESKMMNRHSIFGYFRPKFEPKLEMGIILKFTQTKMDYL